MIEAFKKFISKIINWVTNMFIFGFSRNCDGSDNKKNKKNEESLINNNEFEMRENNNEFEMRPYPQYGVSVQRSLDSQGNVVTSYSNAWSFINGLERHQREAVEGLLSQTNYDPVEALRLAYRNGHINELSLMSFGLGEICNTLDFMAQGQQEMNQGIRKITQALPLICANQNKIITKVDRLEDKISVMQEKMDNDNRVMQEKMDNDNRMMQEQNRVMQEKMDNDNRMMQEQNRVMQEQLSMLIKLQLGQGNGKEQVSDNFTGMLRR